MPGRWQRKAQKGENRMKRLLLCFLLLTISACKEQILHNLDEEEANRLVTHLHDASITADKVQQSDGLWAIAVSDDRSAQALKYLSEARAFRRESLSSRRKGALLRGRDEQRFFYERALSQEIESTLASLSGTLEARVHLNLPEKDPLLGRALSKDDSGSGSVLLVVREPYPQERKEKIARLVSGASGIPIKNISVLISQEQLKQELPLESLGAISRSEVGGSNVVAPGETLAITRSSMGWVLFAAGSILVVLCFFVFPLKRKIEPSNIFGGFS